MESKSAWIVLAIILPLILFLSYGFLVAPQIFNEGGSLNSVYANYVESPSKEILGLDDAEVERYVRTYIWDLYIILFAVLLIVFTDVTFNEFGFDFSEKKKDIIIGILFFAVDLILLGIVMYLTHSYMSDTLLNFHFETIPITGFAAVAELIPQVLNFKFIILNFILYFFFVAPAEETFRIFILIKLEKVSGIFVAVLLSAFVFGFMHMFGSVFQSINAFVGGIAYNLLWLLRGRKILSPIIAHGFYDFAITLIPLFV